MRKMTSKDAMAALAIKALNIIKTELILALPYMARAFDALPFVPDLRTRTMGTDSVSIRFNPRYVVETFRDRDDILKRCYLQMVMHCIFCHMFRMGLYEDKKLYGLCSDISAESVIDGINNPGIYRLSSAFRDEAYDMLSKETEVLTADKLYGYFINNPRDYAYEDALAHEFSLDDHSFWEMPENKKSMAPGSENEKKWQNKAKSTKSDLVHSDEAGADQGSLSRMLRATYETLTDYRKLLEKYAIIREEMKIAPDTFDYGMYSYGLSLYGNMPLIEENEYCEQKAVEDLVIAIDTSASCQGHLVQRFLNETSGILMKSESFFKHTNIVIIECDNQIQKTTELDEPKKIMDYAKGFEIKGGYGTDFRPVFDYVEDLRRAGKLRSLRGLMYFTDGYGHYPIKPTTYETSFVLWKEGAYSEGKIPSWANILYFK